MTSIQITHIAGLDDALKAKAKNADLDQEIANRQAADAGLIPLAQKGAPAGVARFSDVIVSTTAELQAALAAARVAGSGVVRGVPGSTFTITGPLLIGSNTVLDLRGCTIAFANTSVRTNMLQNYAVTPTTTATDAATTAGSSVVASPTLAAQATVGQRLAVVGAGPVGGGVGGGRVWMYGTVLSVVGNNITLGGNLNGVAASVSLSGATAYLFGRDKNITIIGGRWDAGVNWNTLTDRRTANYDSHQLRLRRIDGLTVRGCTLALDSFPAGGGYVFGVAPGDCTDVVVEDITSDGASTCVQGDGPLARVVVRNIRGTTLDDQVAFGCVGQSGNDMEGDITGLLVDGVMTNGSWTACKVFAGSGGNGASRSLKATVKSLKGTTSQNVVSLIDYVGTGTIDLLLEDVTATPGAGFPALVNTATNGNVITNPSLAYAPSESGLLAVTFDPMDAAGTFQPGTGFLYLAMLKVPVGVPLATLEMYVTTVGAGLTAGQNLVGIVDVLGNLRAKTADQATAWTTLGTKAMALTAQGAFTLNFEGGPGTFYWVMILSVGTTTPIFAAKTSLAVSRPGVSTTAVVPAARHRIAFNTTGSRTSLPSSIAGDTLSENNLKTMFWAGAK